MAGRVNRDVSFGMQLPVQAQSTMIRQDWETTAGPAELLAVTQACDRNGYGFVGVCDPVAIPRARAEAMSTVWYDTVATLSWLGAQTENVQLLSHVFILAYRHPLVTAKSFMTIDALTGGRAILGIGSGHVQAEFEALDVPFTERGRLTDEAIKVIRASFADEFGAGDVGQAPRPVQPAGPPIWVGGSSRPALRRAARLGDGWMPQGPPEQGMESAIADIRAWRDEAGRSDQPFAINGGGSFYVGDPGWDVPAWCVTGNADKLAAAVQDVVDTGVTHVHVRLPSRTCSELTDQIEAFGREVIPLVKA